MRKSRRLLRRLERAESTLESARKNFRSEDNIKVQELELKKAEAAQKSAELSLEATKRLAAKGFISALQLQGAEFALEKAKNELEQARQRLKKVKPQE